MNITLSCQSRSNVTLKNPTFRHGIKLSSSFLSLLLCHTNTYIACIDIQVTRHLLYSVVGEWQTYLANSKAAMGGTHLSGCRDTNYKPAPRHPQVRADYYAAVHFLAVDLARGMWRVRFESCWAEPMTAEDMMHDYREGEGELVRLGRA